MSVPKSGIVFRTVVAIVTVWLVRSALMVPLTIPMTDDYAIRNRQGPLSPDAPTAQSLHVPSNGLSGVFVPVLVGAPNGTRELLNVDVRLRGHVDALWQGSIEVVSSGGGHQGLAINFDPITSSAGRIIQLAFRPAEDSQSPLFLATVGRSFLAAGPLRIGTEERHEDVQISVQLIQTSTIASVLGQAIRMSPHIVLVWIAWLGAIVSIVWMLSGFSWGARRLKRFDRLLLSLAVIPATVMVLGAWLF